MQKKLTIKEHKYSVSLIDEMNRYYEARAPWHDDYMSFESAEKMEERLRTIIEIVDSIITDKNIMEVACGTGNWTQVLAARAKSVVAVDNSPASLSIARQKLLNHSNVTLVQESAYELDKIDGEYDVLFAADWWSHVPKALLPLFLQSAIGKLKKGSRAVFLDMSKNYYFENERCEYDSDNNRISLRELPDGSEFKVVKNFPSEAELKDILAPFAKSVAFYEFDSQQRWMVVLEVVKCN